jgi:RimJ/RimL family protein N-acetyltransferase
MPRPDWRFALPTLTSHDVTLRELEAIDAPSLHAMLAGDDVAHFIARPPGSVAGFEHFIALARERRAAGLSICFGVLPPGSPTAVGVFQISQLAQIPAPCVWGWGFVLGPAFWGTGLFRQSAELVLDFAFGTLEAQRLEGWCAVQNGRGNRALQKLGAVRSGFVHQCFDPSGLFGDFITWSVYADAWKRRARRLPERALEATASP